LRLVFKGWIRYKYFYPKGNGMKRKLSVTWVLILGFLAVYSVFPTHAQKFPKTLTLLYSNNVNGEIDPCPT